MTDDIRSVVRDFIANEIMFEEGPSTLTDDAPLMGSIMDSLGLIQLVAFLEEQFEVTIGDDEVTAENFRTVSAIEHLVKQKVQSG